VSDGYWGEDDEGETPLDTNVLKGPGGTPLLCSRMCDTCILRSPADGQIPLRTGRLRQLINDALRGGGFVVCHETGRRGILPAICRGFYDRVGHRSNVLRIWGRLGGYHEVDPPGIAAVTGPEPEGKQ
jgi:hypothetical protein